MAKGADIAKAVAICLPIVAALTKEAEGSAASSAEKHQAVATAMENAYRRLQGSVSEIRDVPWEIVAPLVIPVGDGLISIVVGLFKKLGVFIKKALSGNAN
jgi:hypothetical protein